MPVRLPVILIYDGACPLCNATAKALRIKRAAGQLVLVDARTWPRSSRPDETPPDLKLPPDLRPIEQKPDKLADQLATIMCSLPDPDQGMVLVIGKQYWQGAAALHRLALIGTRVDWFNRLAVWLFSRRWLARLLYPPLRLIRNLLLWWKGADQIGQK